MKYKVGDKVKIKTWRDMAIEFGFYFDNMGIINCQFHYTSGMEKSLQKENRNRIVTIKECFSTFYIIKETKCKWSDDMIQEIAVEREKEEITRFELMDIE